MYIIEKTGKVDFGCRYVARDGAEKSYTNKAQNAKTFRTKEDAEKDKCPENERVVNVDGLFANWRGA